MPMTVNIPPKLTATLTSIVMDSFAISELHVSQILQHVSFCLWLLSLNIISVRFTYVVGVAVFIAHNTPVYGHTAIAYTFSW